MSMLEFFRNHLNIFKLSSSVLRRGFGLLSWIFVFAGMTICLFFSIVMSSFAQEADMDLIEINRRPEVAEDFFRLAHMQYFDLKNHADAEKNYVKAINADPKHSQSFYELAQVMHLVYKDSSRAIDVLLEGIKYNPDVANLYYGLGLIYFDLGYPVSAIDEVERAVEKDPGHLLGHKFLLKMHLDSQQFDFAFDRSKIILQLDPEDELAKKVVEEYQKKNPVKKINWIKIFLYLLCGLALIGGLFYFQMIVFSVDKNSFLQKMFYVNVVVVCGLFLFLVIKEILG